MTRPSPLDCLPGTFSYMPSMIPAEQDIAYYNDRCAYFDRQEANALAGVVHFVGDSRFDGMDLSPACPYALNRGIGGDTFRGVLNRLNRLGAANSIHRAGAVVIAIGVNDLLYENPSYSVGDINYMWSLLRPAMGGKWVVCTIIPTAAGVKGANGATDNNVRIAQANANILSIFAGDPNVQVVDVNATLAPSGDLLPQYTIDGVHLSGAGCDVWRPAIACALASLGIS